MGRNITVLAVMIISFATAKAVAFQASVFFPCLTKILLDREQSIYLTIAQKNILFIIQRANGR
jgi:hypothetical protein